jgi:hypothetical protein
MRIYSEVTHTILMNMSDKEAGCLEAFIHQTLNVTKNARKLYPTVIDICNRLAKELARDEYSSERKSDE